MVNKDWTFMSPLSISHEVSILKTDFGDLIIDPTVHSEEQVEILSDNEGVDYGDAGVDESEDDEDLPPFALHSFERSYTDLDDV